MFRTTGLNFDKLLDKATSNLRLDPDWPSILQICDLIRQNDCTPKYALAAIKKKLYSQNPHQAMFALLVLESMVKNCGSGIHDEISAKANCEMFREFVKSTQHENVRNKMLELIQAWAFAFRNKPKYRTVQDTVNIMKTEGYKFPPLKESDAMFSADTAPDWSDGDVCHRCRVAFSMMQRKHHCRACGQVFCQQCSSKSTTLPKFGIEKEVRVCDACFDLVNRPPGPQKSDSSEAATEFENLIKGIQNPPKKTAEELQEEEELQLAIALSQSEAEHKEKEKEKYCPVHVASSPLNYQTPKPPTPPVSTAPPSSAPPPSQSDELMRYLNRDYWERRASSAAPNASSVAETSNTARASPPLTKTPPVIQPMIVNSLSANSKLGSLQLDENCAETELEEFVAALKSQVEIFVNRMKSNSSRGRSIANDTSVQTLFMNITAMHSRLLRYIQQQDDARVHFEGLQDKLSQVRDSRAALDVLREEHGERVRRAAEAAERQRQMQMAHKLDVMRKKKHEYLQYQRQLALQRIQEQERELQMRQEQQKHQYMMGANAPYFPQNSPVHQYHPAQPGYPATQFPGQQFSLQQMIPSTTGDGAQGQGSIPPQSMIPHGPPQMNQQLGPQPQGLSIGPGIGHQGPVGPMGSVVIMGSNIGSNTLPRSLASQSGSLPQGVQISQMGPHTGQPIMGPVQSGTLRHPGSQIIQGQINQQNQALSQGQNRQPNPHQGQPTMQMPHQQQIPSQQISQQQMQQQQLNQQQIPQQQQQQLNQQQLPQQQSMQQQQPVSQQQQMSQQQPLPQQQIPQHHVSSQPQVSLQHISQQHKIPQQHLPQQQLTQQPQILQQHGQQIPLSQQPPQQVTHQQQQISHQQAPHLPQQQMQQGQQSIPSQQPQQNAPQQNQQIVQPPIASHQQQNIGSQVSASQNVAPSQQISHANAPGQMPVSTHLNTGPKAAHNEPSTAPAPAQHSPPKDATAELISFD